MHPQRQNSCPRPYGFGDGSVGVLADGRAGPEAGVSVLICMALGWGGGRQWTVSTTEERSRARPELWRDSPGPQIEGTHMPAPFQARACVASRTYSAPPRRGSGSSGASRSGWGNEKSFQMVIDAVGGAEVANGIRKVAGQPGGCFLWGGGGGGQTTVRRDPAGWPQAPVLAPLAPRAQWPALLLMEGRQAGPRPPSTNDAHPKRGC